MTSNYLSNYIKSAKKHSQELDHPEWLQKFAGKFSQELKKHSSSKERSAGDRTLVPKAFELSLEHLLKDLKKVACKAQAKISDFEEYFNIPSDKSDELTQLIKTKRVDFAFSGPSGLLLVEFKTNLQFNDIAAAMVEMQMFKELNKASSKNIKTASLHLYPPAKNTQSGLEDLNKWLEKPLDYVWLCCDENQAFNKNTLEEIRSVLHSLTRIRRKTKDI